MTKAVPHILHDVEELLRKRKFEEALSVLGEIDPDSVSPEEQAFSSLLMVEAKIYLGNYDVGETLEEIILYYMNSAENKNYARAKFLHGWLLTALGRLFDAKEVLLESYVHYKRCNFPLGQARALNRLSYVSLTNGDMDSAVAYLDKCKDIYDEIDDEANKAIILLNRSHLLSASGAITEAISQYESAKSIILKRGDRSAAVFYCMSAIPYALKGELDKAEKIIKNTTSHFMNYPREQAIFHENLGWIYIMKGDFKKALEILNKGLKISLEIAPESALISQTKRLLGDACFGSGDYEEAGRYAGEALAVAENINERVEMASCYRLRAQLDHVRSDYDSARTWFKKAIDLFLMIGYRYELAVTRYLAGGSGMYANGERQALLYLAREYFESEGIDHYVEKINREISHTSVSGKSFRLNGEESQKIVTVNSEMRRLVELAENVAASEMSVLLTGTTGTGKDLFARFIHNHSGRSGRFVAVNSAAIPDSMIEAELFGHRKGSFTGAGYDKSGLIEVAEGGTLYLNEIVEASPEFQTKLLDVLENKKIRRLGETSERKVDFRLIAATNHDLDQLVRACKFRADLYHRINEVSIDLPPLQDRLDDIPELTRYFLQQSGVIVNGNEKAFKQLVKVFADLDWPGNVRQLQAEIRRLSLLSDGELARIVEAASDRRPNERERLLQLLKATGWNRRETARRLNLSEATIRRRIKHYNLVKPR